MSMLQKRCKDHTGKKPSSTQRVGELRIITNIYSNKFIKFLFILELPGARTLQSQALSGQFFKGHVQYKGWKRPSRSSILSQSLYCTNREGEEKPWLGLRGLTHIPCLPSTYWWFPRLVAHQKHLGRLLAIRIPELAPGRRNQNLQYFLVFKISLVYSGSNTALGIRILLFLGKSFWYSNLP